MSKLPCKYYLLENRAILISSEDSFFTSKKITDCPFPDSLLSFAYFDLRQWEEKFAEGCKDPSKLLPHKKLSHIPANLDALQRQILFLFQTVLDAELKDIDFSARVHEYEKASRLNRFDFQPMQISYEPVGGVILRRNARTVRSREDFIWKLKQPQGSK